jgi:hypothetical protein
MAGAFDPPHLLRQRSFGSRFGYPFDVLSDELPGILVCSYEPFPGDGACARRIAGLITSLSSHFAITVLTVDAPNASSAPSLADARVLGISLSGSDSAGRVEAFERSVKKQLEAEPPRFVHLMDPCCGYSVFQLKARFSFKVLYDTLVPFPGSPQSPELELKLQKRQKFCAGHADRLLTSQAQQEAWLQEGTRPDRLRVQDETEVSALVPVYLELLKGRLPTPVTRAAPAPIPPPLAPVIPPPVIPPALTVAPQPSPPPIPPVRQVKAAPVQMPVAPPVTRQAQDYDAEVTEPHILLPPQLREVVLQDLWLAQVTQGYCPPENTGFARHTPATNFPGREESPPALPPRKR